MYAPIHVHPRLKKLRLRYRRPIDSPRARTPVPPLGTQSDLPEARLGRLKRSNQRVRLPEPWAARCAEGSQAYFFACRGAAVPIRGPQPDGSARLGRSRSCNRFGRRSRFWLLPRTEPQLSPVDRCWRRHAPADPRRGGSHSIGGILRNHPLEIGRGRGEISHGYGGHGATVKGIKRIGAG